MELYAAVERSAERHGATRLEPSLALEVDRVRARFGVLVRAVPALLGRPGRRAGSSCPRLAELGFDVVYVPPIHPIGADEPQGQEQRARRRARRIPARRTGSARELGGHDAVHPDLGTHDDVRALCAAAAEHGHRHRARLRDQRLARPPVAQGAPGLVPPPPGRHAQVRGEPAQEVPGHLQRQLGHARLARRSGRSSSASSCSGSTSASRCSASTTRTRSRSRSGSG